ncbi:MAG: prepilin-type N-terminal cleavage/methylation domain-containing protein [bacterium]|nr:prepilin-type N-terminal cleavage/methylation domain-containing protein [bacterium]
MKVKKGFTLLELILVIAIMGVLAAMVSGNFITSLKKGRDSRRKGDLEQVQKAVEMYYEDKKMYPLTTELSFSGPVGTGSSLYDPVSGKIYMQKIPNDPLYVEGVVFGIAVLPGGAAYVYCVDSATAPTKYQLYTLLENTMDTSNITPIKLDTCTAVKCNVQADKDCNYGISSSNTIP